MKRDFESRIERLENLVNALVDERLIVHAEINGKIEEVTVDEMFARHGDFRGVAKGSSLEDAQKILDHVWNDPDVVDDPVQK